MIDIKFLRENAEVVQKSSKDKGVEIDVAHILEIDSKYQELSSAVQKLREERNRLAKERNIEAGKELKNRLEKEEQALKAVEEELKINLLKISNIPAPDVKTGKSDQENEVIRKEGEPTKFNFSPKDHLEIGEALDIIDVQRASKVSGTRFAYIKGDGVLLEFAIVQFALETLIKEGFTPVVPPALIKKETMQGLGYMENGGEEDMFWLDKDGMVLVGTAEQSIVPMHKDEIFAKKDLPKRYVGFSSSFRREAGSYGKDTKGILRVHQFDKVEMVSFVTAEDDDKEHEFLLSLEEKLWGQLGIPYQVVKMVTGDLGFPAARKYDLEAWMPSQNKYREVTSTSTTTDFQARRLNIKYQDDPPAGGEKKFTHILNGTAFAIGRTIVAILENYQQEDGSVKVPKILQKMVGKTVIKVSK